MGVARHKIWSDLWANKARTLQVVLIIAMGSAAIGMIVGTRNLVIPQMQRGWQASSPAMINLSVNPPLDEDEMFALKRVDGVEEIEGLSTTVIEWRLNPGDEWSSGGLVARTDYEDQKLNKVALVDGDWPSDRIFAVEQGADVFFGIPERGEVTLRINKHEYQIQLGGTIYNQLAAPASFGGTPQFYTTLDRYEALVGSRDFDQVLATAAEYDEETVADIADRMQAKLEKQGRTSSRMIADPDKHFFQDFMDGIFFMLGVMGLLALILGLFLVYNTINALISQQIDQIGVMKAIGARTGQILRLYVTAILIYSLLALLVAIPLGVFGAWGITSWLVSGFNADPGAFTVSTSAIVVQVVIALLAPLLASLIPILAGARITVREAISTYGLNTKTGLLDRVLAKTQRISRVILLTIANTFRNKWRVVLMEITLVLSGLIFMMVITVRASVVFTVEDVLLSILNYNVAFALENSERIGHVESLALSHPDVKAVEMWGNGSASIRLGGVSKSEDDERAFVFGVPLPTNLYGYQLRAGRWLEPSDTYAVVLNQKLAEDAGVGVGDWVTLNHGGKKESRWLVVGLLFDPVITNSAHVPRDVFLREIGEVGKSSSVWIQTFRDDPASELAISKDLRLFFAQNHIDVSAQKGVFGIGGDSATETADAIIGQFDFLIILLGIMAIIIGSVGSIALSGALSLSVMERRREIGVMRAIGASSGVIARLFIGEGLLLGWLSWLIALPLGLPAGQLMLKGLSLALNLDLVYKYSPVGAMYWLIIITVLSVLASWFPARGAIRISVRESLAYQ